MYAEPMKRITRRTGGIQCVNSVTNFTKTTKFSKMIRCTSRCARSTGICDGWEGCARQKEESPKNETKYYFVSTAREKIDKSLKIESITMSRHPFAFIADVNKGITVMKTVLLSWQEITREEYELYNKLEL